LLTIALSRPILVTFLGLFDLVFTLLVLHYFFFAFFDCLFVRLRLVLAHFLFHALIPRQKLVILLRSVFM
jgi:hypothetical protein